MEVQGIVAGPREKAFQVALGAKSSAVVADPEATARPFGRPFRGKIDVDLNLSGVSVRQSAVDQFRKHEEAFGKVFLVGDGLVSRGPPQALKLVGIGRRHWKEGREKKVWERRTEERRPTTVRRCRRVFNFFPKASPIHT
jgi:hypothetical protein